MVDAGGGGAYLTIQEAVDHLLNLGPCTIMVRPGTYHESVTIEGKNSLAVSESQRIVIQSETPGAVVLDPSTLTGFRVGVRGVEAESAHALTISSTSGAISGFRRSGLHDHRRGRRCRQHLQRRGTTIAGHDLTIEGNSIQQRRRDGSGIEIGVNNPRLWISTISSFGLNNTGNEARYPLAIHELDRHHLRRQQHDRRERLERPDAAGEHGGRPDQQPDRRERDGGRWNRQLQVRLGPGERGLEEASRS
jgi:hypothetical protein